MHLTALVAFRPDEVFLVVSARVWAMLPCVLPLKELAMITLVRIIGLGAIATMIATGCAAKDKPSESTQCGSAREFFATEVWASVMGKICIDCHGPGGLAQAAGASFQLLPPGYPGFLDENFKAAQQIAQTKYEGTPVLLLKPTGHLNHGGGRVITEGSKEYQTLAELATRMEDIQTCPPAPAPAIDGVLTLGPAATLRKASIQLVGKLPNPDAVQAVVDGGEAALPGAIDALTGTPEFIDRIKEIWNDVLLTDRYLSYNGRALNTLDSTDFPYAASYYSTAADDVKSKINLAVAREPLDLIGYITANDHPFTEVLTANYTVLSDASAAVYNAGPALADYGPPVLREGKIISLHGGGPLDWPHAGVLTSPMFLDRFPTTLTNRNRHRARKIYEIFLATNILKIAERPINPQESAKYINPTRDDPTCNQCHRQIDPVAGAFLHFSDYSQTSYQPEHQWHPEMFAPGFGADTMQVSEFDHAPAWLAEHIVADPRFPLAVVYTMYRALIGHDPLDYPEATDAPDYAAMLAAWRTQDATLGAMSAAFQKNGFNLKTLVRDIVLSPYFRADGIVEGATPTEAAELANIGTARISTPEVLTRKILAVTGVPWSHEWDLKDWLLTDYRILYGGIDSDIVVDRLTTPNGVMAAVQQRMANETACEAAAWDFLQPQAQRFLFRYVELTDTAQSNPDAVRKNAQYLHAQILGEDLPLADPEIDRTVQLFTDTITEGAQKITAGTLSGSLPWACQGRRNPVTGEVLADTAKLTQDKDYVVRAWMAVVTYLLSDYRFLYE